MKFSAKAVIVVAIAAGVIPYAYRGLGKFFADKEHNAKAIRAALSGGVLSDPQGFTSHCGLPLSTETGNGEQVLHYRENLQVTFHHSQSVTFSYRNADGSLMPLDEEFAMREIPCYPEL